MIDCKSIYEKLKISPFKIFYNLFSKRLKDYFMVEMLSLAAGFHRKTLGNYFSVILEKLVGKGRPVVLIKPLTGRVAYLLHNEATSFIFRRIPEGERSGKNLLKN